MMTSIPNLDELIRMALLEDVGDGDHSTLSCIPPTATNSAKMVAKQEGIVCGMEVGERVFHFVNDSFYHTQIPMKVTLLKKDGDKVAKGDVLMTVEGASGAILTAERTALNFMQRLSGIATQTNKMVRMLDGLHTQLLDTRKTTPNMRLLEKYAVKCGGGTNHRIGLYDMVMLKDNHIDFAGGIEAAIDRTHWTTSTPTRFARLWSASAANTRPRPAAASPRTPCAPTPRRAWTSSPWVPSPTTSKAWTFRW